MKFTRLLIIISLFVCITMIVSCQKNMEQASAPISKVEETTESTPGLVVTTTIEQSAAIAREWPVDQVPLTMTPLFKGINLVDGKEFTLESLKDHVLIIDFWAPWCPPCRAEIPGFMELQNKYKDKKFSVIGIAVSSPESDVKAFIDEQKINYPVIMGTDNMRKDYEKAIGQDIRAIPTTLIANRKGEIIAVHVGAEEMSVFESALESLLEASSSGE